MFKIAFAVLSFSVGHSFSNVDLIYSDVVTIAGCVNSPVSLFIVGSSITCKYFCIAFIFASIPAFFASSSLSS